MTSNINNVDLLARREIEALIAAPLIKAYAAEIGMEKAEIIAATVIAGLARDSGKALAAFTGGNRLAHLEEGLSLFSQNGNMEFDMQEKSVEKMVLHIKRCKYAEMYRNHGLEKFGYLLSCARDYALFGGFNPDIRFTRTQTIMQGADYCDFCIELPESE